MGQKYSGTNINTITGFEIAAKKPIDPRMQVDTREDLEKIQYQWTGMTVYVEDESEDYQLKENGWVKKSTQGPKGEKGEDGKSAYEVWLGQPENAGKSEQEYLASLKGEKGETGAKGEKGDPGVAGAKGEKGDPGAVGPQGAEGAQGPAGQKGEKGDPFSIAKVYTSVAEMNSGYATDGVPQGGFVVINTGNVEDEDNAKLFYKGKAKYEYLTDLSGAKGMTGPQGETGATGKQGPVGPQGETGAKGEKGEKGDPGDNVRVGTDYGTAKQTKLFFKVIN